MPQVDYKKTIIYKIQHKEKDELLYVGSTTHFGNRKAQHKRACYNPNGKTYNSKIYTTIRDNGGWDAFNMVVIKEFPCKNKQEALTEEDRVMRQMLSSLNTYRAYTTKEEKKKQQKQFYNLNKDKIKEYREQNRDKFKEYREQNRDKISEKKKEYRVQNRNKLIGKNKEYYEQNKEKLKEKKKEQTKCECGCMIRKDGLPRHKRSKKHQEYLNQQTDQ
jgi:hypothetical protein